ncbi:MAG: hypothetical protein WBX01_08195 [Nitrososphaeraceae archaeon]
MSINLDQLVEGAKNTLDGNWVGDFTIPSATLYPHQWSWDSTFIAIGNSYLNTKKAMQELNFLFDAQWKNGMVPHIVFNEKEKTYFPAAKFYDITRSPNAPKHIGTSGMTQPPVHAIACYYIYKNARKNGEQESEVIKFLNNMFPKLVRFHRYLMTERDPEKSGTITILHPWESGLDDSPIWDDALSKIKIERLLKFKRLDVIAVEGAKDTIPSDDMYNKFIYMIELMKEFNYDEQVMYKEFPFKIKAIIFSSILYVANKYLLKIADVIDESNYTDEIKEWLSRTQQNFYKYFFPALQPITSITSTSTISAPNNGGGGVRVGSDVPRLGMTEDYLFFNYDIVNKDWIKKKTISSLVPIYTGLIPQDDIELFVKWITHSHWCGEGKCSTPALPSTDLEESYFKKVTYWRGPIWVNTNWLIYLGLLKYGYHDIAQNIKQGILDLVSKSGFREYYNPFTGEGLGGKSFSWTAALVIDMINDSKGLGIPSD